MLTQYQLEQLRSVPIPTVLASLGVHPARRQGHQLVYHSPLRKGGDSDPSFFVDPADNVWKDFGMVTTGKSGGNVVDMVMQVGEVGFEEAAAYLKPFLLSMAAAMATSTPAVATSKTALVDLVVQPLTDPALLLYLERRGINAPWILAHNRPVQELLKQATYRMAGTATQYRNVAWRNQLAGNNVELKGPGKDGTTFTRCHGNKTITIVPGKDGTKARLHVFESFMDYLAMLMRVRSAYLLADVLVLNSTMMAPHAIERARAYTELWLWLDNDPGGRRCTAFWKANHPNVVDKSGDYAPFKDINDWLLNKPQQPKRVIKPAANAEDATNHHRKDVAKWWLWARWSEPQVDANGELWKSITYYSFDDELPSLNLLKQLRTRLAKAGKIDFSRLCVREPGKKADGKSQFKVLEAKEHLPK